MNRVSSAKKNRRVLVIDDNPDIHQDFRKILVSGQVAPDLLDNLEAEFFETQEIESSIDAFDMDSAFQGQEGAAKLRQAMDCGQPYALAFVDMRMPPGWDGVETIAQLWKIDPRLQVVICTAYSDYSWEAILNQLGRRDGLAVLKKPFDNVEVLQLAEILAKKWALSHEADSPTPELSE